MNMPEQGIFMDSLFLEKMRPSIRYMTIYIYIKITQFP